MTKIILNFVQCLFKEIRNYTLKEMGVLNNIDVCNQFLNFEIF